jgi:hypothetical protein
MTAAVWYEDSLADFQRALITVVSSLLGSSTVNLLVFCHKLSDWCYDVGQLFALFFNNFFPPSLQPV